MKEPAEKRCLSVTGASAISAEELLLWDVFRAHRSEAVLEKLRIENIEEVIFIPANCNSQ